ncbi:MAG: hypothetical protein KH135_01625 [Firmicutes bacterium]|nr:hypothetical protein [Bacillota bacterium]
MKSKISLIISILTTTVAMLYLLQLCFDNPNDSANLAVIPILICVVALVSKYVLILMNRTRLVPFFHKAFIFGFLLYWFGFLLTWCYHSIKLEDYESLLFTIPGWIIGILIVRKKIFDK